MPPRRSIASSARSLYGEPEPPVYFPTPVGAGVNGFGSYVSPGYAANAVQEDEELDAKRDDMLTRRADNLLRRANNASSLHLLPFKTTAEVAKERLGEARATSDLETLPEEVEAQRLVRDEHKKRAEALPQVLEDEAEIRKARIQALRDVDPVADRLQRMHGANAEDLFAYQRFSELAPPELPVQEQRQWARDHALGLMRDKEAVAAADYLANEMDPDTGKAYDAGAKDLIEAVTDKSGRLIGQRIKEGADPGKVADMILGHRRRLAERAVKQKRLAEESAYYDRDLDNTSKRLGLIDAQLANPAIDKDLKKTLEAQRAELQSRYDTLNDEWRQLRGKPALGKKAETAPAPATAPSTPAAPTGRAANVADFYKKK